MSAAKNFWTICETDLRAETTKAWEGIFAQGNGWLHIRGSFEEGLQAARQDEEYMRLPANVTVETPRHPRSKCGTYIPGITGNHPLLREEMVNLPNPLRFSVRCGEEALDMDTSRIDGYCRSLNMEDGTLTRTFCWHTGESVLECAYERQVSRGDRHVILQEMTFRAAEGNPRLVFESGIDTEVRTNGWQHFAKVEKGCEGNLAWAFVRTDSGDEAAFASVTEEVRTASSSVTEEEGAASASVTGKVKAVSSSDGRKVSGNRPFSGSAVFAGEVCTGDRTEGEARVAAVRELLAGECVKIRKVTYVCTDWDAGADGEALVQAAVRGVKKAAENVDNLRAVHTALWKQLWDGCRIEIEGDEKAQRALNFSMYHLLRCGNPFHHRGAICAKGLAGEAYFGHFFWDSEIYLMPFYLNAMQEAAGNLARFRIATLPGAEKNAARGGYRGAKYPWESSVNGEEQCPNWQYADHEIHINADVAFGLWNYYQFTKDQAFLEEAAPVFVKTALYWLDRITWDADGRAQIRGVMGPDEYICFCNNNAYTNDMARRSLEWTLQVMEILAKKDAHLPEKLGCGKELQAQIARAAAGLRVRRGENGLIWQCDDFENYEEPRFDLWWQDRTKPYGACVSQERNYRTKALKQADVLMLPYLFPGDYTDEEIRENYDYYVPYTTHDSSLSCIIHAILCIRLGREEEGRRLFERACGIDLDAEKGGAAEGIHIANCGGIWQAVVYGFAGMSRPWEEERRFSPRLPAHWKSLRLRWRENQTVYEAVIKDNNSVQVRAVQG